MESDLNEVCIIDKEDLVQCCSIQLESVDEIVENVNFLYSIKKKNIYVIDVINECDKSKDYYFDGREGLWILYNKIQHNVKESFLLAYKKTCTLVSKCLNCSDFQKRCFSYGQSFC
ncbi:MAG: hypothetical protein ACTJLM_03970 [Ehrlichia sp.]